MGLVSQGTVARQQPGKQFGSLLEERQGGFSQGARNGGREGKGQSHLVSQSSLHALTFHPLFHQDPIICILLLSPFVSVLRYRCASPRDISGFLPWHGVLSNWTLLSWCRLVCSASSVSFVLWGRSPQALGLSGGQTKSQGASSDSASVHVWSPHRPDKGMTKGGLRNRAP